MKLDGFPLARPLLHFASAAQANGLKYVSGDTGFVKQLLFNEKGDYIGALAVNEASHLADVIPCTGANTATLVDTKDEIVARSHCVVVIF